MSRGGRRGSGRSQSDESIIDIERSNYVHAFGVTIEGEGKQLIHRAPTFISTHVNKIVGQLLILSRCERRAVPVSEGETEAPPLQSEDSLLEQICVTEEGAIHRL